MVAEGPTSAYPTDPHVYVCDVHVAPEFWRRNGFEFPSRVLWACDVLRHTVSPGTSASIWSPWESSKYKGERAFEKTRKKKKEKEDVYSVYIETGSTRKWSGPQSQKNFSTENKVGGPKIEKKKYTWRGWALH